MIRLLFLPFLVMTFYSQGQQKIIQSITTTHPVVFAAVDRPGDFYVVLNNGTIEKYDKNGSLVARHTNPSVPTLFDPHDGAHLFAYFQTDHRYQYLSPELSVINELILDSAFAINPVLICLSGDRELWILDTADYSLKRTVLMGTSLRQEQDFHALLTSKPRFTYMREYQNFLFLLDQNSGILIFNSVGKLIKTIAVPGLRYFNFLGEELYYSDKAKLHFFDLFSGETREQQFPVTGEFMLLTDERYIVINQNAIGVFEFKP